MSTKGKEQPHEHPQRGPLDAWGNCPGCAVYKPEMARVFDPDGEEQTLTVEEARAMKAQGKAIECQPDDFGGFLHWHVL